MDPSDDRGPVAPTTGSADTMRDAATALRQARRVVVFTGAGLSADSGIPTFRDASTGLWRRFDPAVLATTDAFRRDPALVWGWYAWRRGQVLRARPNAGHRAIAALAQAVPVCTLITQNVDDLHERAGSASPIHLHGRLDTARCLACSRPHALPADPPCEPEGGRRLAPPRCVACDGPVRPGVVWFGEALPSDAWDAAVAAVRACDLMLVVGTSGLVHPAAGLTRMAAAHGASIVRVDPNPVPADGWRETHLAGRAVDVLPALLTATWGGRRVDDDAE